MLIKELCDRASVSKESVRHYESLGLLRWKPLQAGSRIYRDYDENMLERLKYIQLGKRLGFTLKEMKPLLDAYDDKSLSSEQQINVLQQQVDKLELMIQELSDTKAFMLEKIQRIQQRKCIHSHKT